MKKIITIILLIITINIKAYENEYFTINIPNNFTQDDTKVPIYKWTNKSNTHENIVITVSKNDNHKQIKNYNSEDIINYEKYLKEQFDQKLKDYNVNIEVSNTKKEILNGIYNLNYDVYWPTKEAIGYDTYQKGYIFTINDFIFVYNFTSDKSLLDNNYLIDSINSFKPNDSIINSKNLKIKLVILIGTLTAITSTIIKHIIKSKKHKSNN